MNEIRDYKTEISEEDRIIFNELPDFLEDYNDDQKKAIISDNNQILCIAGAGSGKTTVLAKRIEFLVKYRGVNPQKILAITFTRKAKEEMQKRLMQLGINPHVHTFNSFSERVLKLYWNNIYSRPTKIIDYGSKVMMLVSALSSMDLTINQAIEGYYTQFQRTNKPVEQLSNSFLNDCFSVLEYFKLRNEEIYDFSENAYPEDRQNARMMYQICKYINQQMKLAGLRDFTDQILDTINFFESSPNFIPEFEHILIDEYQDINSTQAKLIDLLNSKNLFCVGDPRQSIFGWRGSDIGYILNFQEKYPASEIISLTKNYRSNNNIVDLINKSVKNMGLPDLEPNFEQGKQIYLKKFNSEEEEHEFVINNIIASPMPGNEIFVLARTNRQLNQLSEKLKQMQIPHIIKIEGVNLTNSERNDCLILATIHAIKGLEAQKVFVIGCNEQNFPCRASDHPVIDIIKTNDYDREEEERRLFYVAISRAKNKLYLTYTGKKPTSFITDEMLNLIEDKPIFSNIVPKIPPKLNPRIQAWKEEKEEYKEPDYELEFEKESSMDLESEIESKQTSSEFESTPNLPETEIINEISTSDEKYGESIFDEGSGYPKDYNPYKGEDWDEMVSDE